jgi:hypothetical protein
MRRQPLAPHLSLIEDCASGGGVCLRTRFLCDGQLARAVLSAPKMPHLFGFVDAWLAIASQLLRATVLVQMRRFLHRLCDRTLAVRSLAFTLPTSTGAKHREAVHAEGDVLYTEVLWMMFQARDFLPSGCYEVGVQDILWDKITDLITRRYLFKGDDSVERWGHTRDVSCTKSIRVSSRRVGFRVLILP